MDQRSNGRCYSAVSGGMPTAVRVGMFDQTIAARIQLPLVWDIRELPSKLRCTPRPVAGQHGGAALGHGTLSAM
jgi:hypothetical protein